MDYFGAFMFAWLDRIFSDTHKTPLNRLRTFFAEFLDYYRSRGYKGGCPIGNLSQEMGDINDSIAAKAEVLIGGMKSRFINMLRKARDKGEVKEDLDLESTADFMINAWQGAVLRTKILRNDSALNLFDDMIFNTILKKE